MADNPNKTLEEQMLHLRAAVGSAVGAVASIDMTLVMLISDIVHPMPAPQDLPLASALVFDQPSIERRFEITRKIITIRLAGALETKRHEYPHLLAQFILKAFNLVCDEITSMIWIRNTAAHGNPVAFNPPYIIPSPFDFAGVERFHVKKKIPGKPQAFPKEGLTTRDLSEFIEKIKEANRRLNAVADVMREVRLNRATPALEAKVVALGTDLKLRPPLQERPRRAAKPKPKPKTPRGKQGK